MRAFVIESGAVANVVEVSNLSQLPNLIDATWREGGIGWLWDGSTLSPPPVVVQPVVVPSEVTMRQASLALYGAGLLDDIEALVATLPRQYQIEWERASTVARDNALVAIVQQQQGMTDTQIDNLFINAATL